MDVKAILLGLLASFFFAVTFVLNRAMDLSGGSWIWSASLRFIFMVPFLFLIVFARGNLKQLFVHMKQRPLQWLIWSIVGFGLFYAPLTFAASFGPGWLIAGTWQITIITGSLVAPLIERSSRMNHRHSFPLKSFIFSMIILIGVVFMQMQQAGHLSVSIMLLSILPIIVAAFAYPLGNRKMMLICSDELDTFQRVLGMTLASLPLWFILSMYGLLKDGLPSADQTLQTFIVAISSGVIATVLFFIATDLVRNDAHKLAAVEATQSGEVIFALLGELIILNGKFPAAISMIGIAFVIIGMVLHSFKSSAKEEKKSLDIGQDTTY